MNGSRTTLGKKSKISGNKEKQTQNNPKLMGHSKGSPEREVHSNTGLCKKDRNISNKQPNPTYTRTGGTATNKAQSKQKEGNSEIRAEVNDRD